MNHKIVSAECAREVVQIIEETEVDIEADPLLERACALDLLKYCKDLEHGAGRSKIYLYLCDILQITLIRKPISILILTGDLK